MLTLGASNLQKIRTHFLAPPLHKILFIYIIHVKPPLGCLLLICFYTYNTNTITYQYFNDESVLYLIKIRDISNFIKDSNSRIVLYTS